MEERSGSSSSSSRSSRSSRSSSSSSGKVVEGRRLIASYVHSVDQHQYIDLSQSNRLVSELLESRSTVEGVVPNKQHLFVLVHGLSAFAADLGVLETQLTAAGCQVLMSQSNEFTKSFRGTIECSQCLVDEIVARKAELPDIRYISLVGNSFGGILVRVAAKMLLDLNWLNLTPVSLMTIATPHLGVRFFTYVEETLGLAVPFREQVVNVISSLLSKTGSELLMNDSGDIKDSQLHLIEETLIYKIACQPAYLDALAAFRQRRIYCNLFNDSVVPLRTAAFLDDHTTSVLRERHRDEKGIVAILVTEKKRHGNAQAVAASNDTDSTWTETERGRHASKEALLEFMAEQLDSIGWSKVVVHFPGYLPTAHSKLAAITRFPLFLHGELLGFKQGMDGMKHAAEWLLQLDEDEEDEEGVASPPRLTSNPLFDPGAGESKEGNRELEEGKQQQDSAGFISGGVLHI